MAAERYWPWPKGDAWKGIVCIRRSCGRPRPITSSFCPGCQAASRKRNAAAVADFKANPPRDDEG